MSALFGHVKGAFTGAATGRSGLLKSADGGLLFLDEIGELGLDEQAMLLRAVEEQRFLPVGSDCEVTARFQLIAGTNRDLSARVQDCTFREDLLARVNLWTFSLPGLRDRREDIEPNLDYELQRLTREFGHKISLAREAREKFLAFCVSPNAVWSGNFRDLSAAMTRMATLSAGGRIGVDQVQEECGRLKTGWSTVAPTSDDQTLRPYLTTAQINQLDLFDRGQLESVLEVCERSASLAEAGRTLYARSRLQRTSVNDSDRVRKYLARFDLTWKQIRAASTGR